MKKLCVLTALLLWCLAAPALAEEFATLPIMEGGRAIKSGSNELVKEYDVAPEVLWQFYKGALGKEKEIRFRERDHNYTIEDMAGRPWRRISITKTQSHQTTVAIDLMSWSWMLIMLALRFTAVFVVLLVLYLSTSLCTRLLTRMVKQPAKQVA